jgi:uracil-DNA glycosylase family 4
LLKCEKCPLQGKTKVVRKDYGKDVKVLIVGEAPGVEEEIQGEPFIGRAGQLLREVLQEIGIDINSVSITNTCLCRPSDANGKNRPPTPEEIECCKSRLLDEVRTSPARIVLLLGNVALRAVLGKNGIKKHAGYDIYDQDLKKWIIVTYHPAAVLRNYNLLSAFKSHISKVKKYLNAEKDTTEYAVVHNLEDFLYYYGILNQSTVIAYDIETNQQLSPFSEEAVITTIAFSWDKGKVVCIPLNYQEAKYTPEEIAKLKRKKQQELRKQGLPAEERKKIADEYEYQLLNEKKGEPYLSQELVNRHIIPRLHNLFSKKDVIFVAHNAMFDALWLNVKYGIPCRMDFDTKIAGFMINENDRNNLKYLASLYTDMVEYEAPMEVFGKYQFLLATPEVFFRYNCSDADATYRLYLVLKQKLKDEGVERAYQMVLKFAESLLQIQRIGFKIDQRGLDRYMARIGEKLLEKLEEIKNRPEVKSWESRNQKEFLPHSSQHVSDILFNCLGLTPHKTTEAGNYSVDKEVLSKLAEQHPLPKLIDEYKKLHKFYTSFLCNLKKASAYDGRIHTSFNPVGTKTGRISSSEPNLQNIPAHETKDIKKLFIPTYPDWYIMQFDYSQMELRVLASLANEEKMIEDFRSGKDIHRATAQRVFNTEEVTDEQRSFAKRINFGIVYGMSAKGLAELLNIPLEEAQGFINAYFETYPKIKQYINEYCYMVRTYGYVTTPFGRKRRLPEVMSGNRGEIASAERKAINAPIQATASDITQIAIYNIQKILKAQGLQARVVLTVHDSIVLEVPEEEVREVYYLVKDIMENLPLDFMKVPLVADAGIGKNYGELVDVEGDIHQALEAVLSSPSTSPPRTGKSESEETERRNLQ